MSYDESWRYYMTLKEKIERTKRILNNTPKFDGKLINAVREFPTFIVRADGTVFYLLKPRQDEGQPWYKKFLEFKETK